MTSSRRPRPPLRGMRSAAPAAPADDISYHRSQVWRRREISNGPRRGGRGGCSAGGAAVRQMQVGVLLRHLSWWYIRSTAYFIRTVVTLNCAVARAGATRSRFPSAVAKSSKIRRSHALTGASLPRSHSLTHAHLPKNGVPAPRRARRVSGTGRFHGNRPDTHGSRNCTLSEAVKQFWRNGFLEEGHDSPSRRTKRSKCPVLKNFLGEGVMDKWKN